MTRTDVVASSRPRKAGAKAPSRGSRACRRLSVVPIVLLLAATLLGPQAASAAESTSGYSQTVPTPKTTTTPATTPTTGTSPTKEEKTTTSSKETAPTSTSPTSTTSTSKEKASTLPFTGLDLRWVLGIGVLLLGAGFSLVLVDRRQRRGTGR
jgi:uncharacterized surface anchored protein